jgi:GTP-binding protein EngB required for normal cell division
MESLGCVMSKEFASSSILSEKLSIRYKDLKTILEKGIDLATELRTSEDSIKDLRERLQKLECAAMFVIVGEVKAGKSSFINALLGEEICDVDAAPCTATIQELVHGGERRQMQLGEKCERIFLPFGQLKAITIVDTPGTNSIIKEHQLITENYLPQCDVAVFVLTAKNPHTATAWELLTLIRRDWMHRVVFVLQQADLASKAELDKNLDMVRTYARERNVSEPKIFPLSALREKQGAQDSGFAEFRAYLRSSVESGDVWQIKFDGACNILGQVIRSIRSDLHKAKSQTSDDLRLVDDLENTLTQRKTKIEGLRQLVIDSLLSTYDQLTDGLKKNFGSGLEVGTILRRSLPFVRDKTIKDWLHQIEREFQSYSTDVINEAAAASSRQLEAEIASMIDAMESKVTGYMAKTAQPQQNLVDDREEIIRSLSDAMNRDSLRKHLQKGLPEDISLQGNLLGGGGLVFIGASVALLTKIAIFEITGGILTAIGALLIAVTLLWKRGAVVKELNQKISQGRDNFEQRISTELTNLFERLFHEISHNLSTTRQKLEKAKSTLEPQIHKADEILNEVGRLRGE